MSGLIERFWTKVDRRGPDECWPWLDSTAPRGYGRFWDGHRQQQAHRAAYELLVGPIPDGLQIDHLCRNRGCVNPAHLEPVTQRENVLRGIGPTANNAGKTHCKRGHEYTPENTGWQQETRFCRTCRRLTDKEWRKSRSARATSTKEKRND